MKSLLSRTLLSALVATVFLLHLPMEVDASVTYLYEGETYGFVDGPYVPGQRITGSFTVSAPIENLTPLQDISASLVSFSFFDGIITYAISNPNLFIGAQGFNVETDGSGMITDWLIDLGIGFPFPTSIGSTAHGLNSSIFFDAIGLNECTELDSIDPFCVASVQAGGAFVETPGIWTIAGAVPEPPSVPEPTTLLLLGLGLAGLGFTRRRWH